MKAYYIPECGFSENGWRGWGIRKAESGGRGLPQQGKDPKREVSFAVANPAKRPPPKRAGVFCWKYHK